MTAAVLPLFVPLFPGCLPASVLTGLREPPPLIGDGGVMSANVTRRRFAGGGGGDAWYVEAGACGNVVISSEQPDWGRFCVRKTPRFENELAAATKVGGAVICGTTVIAFLSSTGEHSRGGGGISWKRPLRLPSPLEGRERCCVNESMLCLEPECRLG